MSAPTAQDFIAFFNYTQIYRWTWPRRWELQDLTYGNLLPEGLRAETA